VVEEGVNKDLDCGDLTKGFARIYCENCKKSMLMAFSCKGRGLCPSCQEKKVLLFGEFIIGTFPAKASRGSATTAGTATAPGGAYHRALL
jgi:hypothetical protein